MEISSSIALNLSNEQQETALHIAKNLLMLRSSVESARSAVVLCEHAEILSPTLHDFRSQQMVEHWRMIAGREIALHIYSFHDSIEAIGGLVQGCPTIIEALDHSALGLAKVLLQAHFPKYDDVWIGTSYPEQDGNSPPTGTEHVISSTKVRLSEDVLKNAYTAALGHQMLSYKVSKDTATKLHEIAVTEYRAFVPLFGASFLPELS